MSFSNIPLEHSYFLITEVAVPVVHYFQPVHHLLVSKVSKLGRIGLRCLIGFLSHLRQLKDTLDELDYYHYTYAFQLYLCIFQLLFLFIENFCRMLFCLDDNRIGINVYS